MRSSLKQVFELGPLVVFFYFFIKTGKIEEAILPLMIAAGVAIVGSYIIDRKVSPMLLFSTILIFIFDNKHKLIKYRDNLNVKCATPFLSEL